jgi:uncharacterized membrane protein YgdD (TMEM256/DUF423 family)
VGADERGPAFYVVSERGGAPLLVAAGWSFAAGIVLFSGSLYALAVTGPRTLGAVTPFGGAGLLLGWAFLLLAIVLK